MSVFLSALLMISHAGQKIQKSYEELKQNIYEEYYKLAKDFLRYVRTRPVCMNMFGFMDINMSMLPAIVGFFTTYTVIGVTSVSSVIMNVYSMAVFLMALFMVSREGQKIQNNYRELRQRLCKLSVHTIENEEYYKLVKDLLRYVRTRTVRMHVCGFMDVNMSMLPCVVAFFTSYTVIVLQFNNVL
ncbi:hypothetical protein PYW08_016435 [Mythimna loreyi]|uniref:Uncharacterized protein n=1 Tax=Mythimna loreyi TaxID=667449 RepID=A0ACC2QX06_9NEOP|nr:hypothetical protein PYW08_016435 [Mythimna loreyi]